jgi:hypothetical protein
VSRSTHLQPVAAPSVQPTEAAPTKSWSVEADELLARAAALCVEHGIELDAWMRKAWSAYVEARPGYREFLEETQLREQLKQLREAGRVGQA